MQRRMAVLRTIAVGALAAALGGAALGADAVLNVQSSDATRDSGGASNEQHANFKVDLAGAATSLMEALTGGTNPSTTLATKGGSGKEHANAKDQSAKEDETNVQNAQETEDND